MIDLNQVSTEHAGVGFLSVGIQSNQPEVVQSVVVSTVGSLHTIKYRVSKPGYYIIFVKWRDQHIADSPFICKVTF